MPKITQPVLAAILSIFLLAGCATNPPVTAAPGVTPGVTARATAAAAAPAAAAQPADAAVHAGGEIHWPGETWPTAEPEARGLDAAKLSALTAAAPKRAPNLSSVLVIRGGDLVLEQYFGPRGAGDSIETYSVTKSFVATLIGIAIDQGFIDRIDAPLLSFFPERQPANPGPAKDLLTLEQVLTMSTGLEWSEADIDALYRSSDWTQFMLDLPVVEPPGSRFNYCSGCSHLLSALIQQKTGMDSLAFARQFLFEPIGMRGATWLSDSQGLAIGGWGLHITPPDMARLGYLYLRQGDWDGRQVVSAEWVKAATADHIAVGDNPRLRYGYQWWVRPSIEGYAALGRAGQMIAVIPGKDLVIVFTASGVEHETEFELIEEYILPAVR